MEKNKRPLFSITTPCFNSEKTIERTIKSVLAQEFKDYEYIIVDGGSKDGTLDIVRRYETLFEGRMRWQSEPDKGIYDAFNKGVKLSKGYYCWNVNSDDYIENDSLNVLSTVIYTFKNNNLPIIAGALRHVDENGTTLSVDIPNKDQIKNGYLNDSMGIPHPSTLVPRNIYEKYGDFDINYKIIGDADWFHRIYSNGVRIEIVEAVLSNMSNVGVSSQYSWKRFKNSWKDRLYFVNKFYDLRSTRIKKLTLFIFRFTKKVVKQII